MCGRFIWFSDRNKVKQFFDFEQTELAMEPNYNAAPGQDVYAIVNHGANTLARLRWGLVPSWAKDPSIGYKMINARAETLADKPSFRKALARQRCLILADGFYEWKREGATKTPFFIRMKDENPFGFAGLYEHWQDADGQTIESCTIVTTEPNSLLAPIHNRMPVIIPRDRHEQWLDPEIVDKEPLLTMLKPYPAEQLESYQVSLDVNNPKNNSPELIKRVA
jgi:putative SOS response-associated peptidase YedK